jgi:uncharacterized protein (TIGR00661 family)
MARCLFIVQGEGKGHMSQALALKEYLLETGHTVEAVLLGTDSPDQVPEYFREAFPDQLSTFRSPCFLRTPNKKGIYVGRTLIYNLFYSMDYLKTIARIRREINTTGPDVVFNFYELLGALAMRKIAAGIRTIAIGHHFYYYLKSTLCKKGPVWHRILLRLHSRLIIRSSDRVLALSYRKEQGSATIQVIPPLVRRAFREMTHHPGDRYLVYFLHEGFFYDLLMLARSLPDFKADLFTSLKPAIEVPEGIMIHAFDAEKFRNLMASCKGLITTAGFDTAAEAACQGIPLAVIPSHNHYEQHCNGVDIAEKGIGLAVSQIDRSTLEGMRSFENGEYRTWVHQAGEQIIKILEE